VAGWANLKGRVEGDRGRRRNKGNEKNRGDGGPGWDMLLDGRP